MKKCPYCGYENREGLLFCEDCGQGLAGPIAAPTLPTRNLGETSTELSAKATWGTASLSKTSAVVVHIRDETEPIILELADQLIIGRTDTSSPRQPQIDLTPYGALEKGVSRIHAAIERSDDVLTIVDMGSSNGTFLNGQRLLADQPRVLRDGDEIRFGKLVAHVYFK